VGLGSGLWTALGFRVFLAQRDGPEKDPDFAAMDVDERSRAIFTADRDMSVVERAHDGRVQRVYGFFSPLPERPSAS